MPWDQYCRQAPCTDQLSATIWTQKRLSGIRTQVRRGGEFKDVESWTLEHQWLDAGDSDGEAIPMWLKGITRTGHVTQAGGPVVSDPQIVFDPGADPFPNRVKKPEDGFSRAQWVYDTLADGIGKLARSIRYHDGAAYISEPTGYDTAGRATGTRVTIPATETGLAGTYTTTSGYRPDGSIATTTLPEMGGLPAERIVSSYNDVGARTGMISEWGLYTNSVTYNKLGN